MASIFTFTFTFNFMFLIWASYSTLITAQQTLPIKISLGSTLSPSTILTSSWLSPSRRFAFGFYPQGQGFTIGIWFAQLPEKTVVWTANQDDPLVSKNATLLLTSKNGLVLQLGDGLDRLISNASESAFSASMLNTGNFVVYNSDLKIIWQTFDIPTNTILQGQQLKGGEKLVSSVSETDQSTGRFWLYMQQDNNLVLYPYGRSDALMAYWATDTNLGSDEITANLDDDGHFYLLQSNGSILKNVTTGGFPSEKTTFYRVTIDSDGILRLYSLGSDENGSWSIKWSSSSNKCDPTGICGLNQYCVPTEENVCNCLPGFDFIDVNQKTLGCAMKFSANAACRSKQDNILIKYTMHTLEQTTWEDNPYSVLKPTTKEGCEEACSGDCYCEAALFKNQQCRKQKIPLRYIQRGVDAKDPMTALIKASTTIESNGSTTIESKVIKKETRIGILIMSFVLITFSLVVLAISGILIYRNCIWVHGKIKDQRNVEMKGEIILRSFTYNELEKSTDGFKVQVGRGSSGTVFKGILLSPTERRIIAVKRLERVVEEGEREFQTEMKVIARTHHRNLVRLLGYCHEGPNRLLVYEYMTNGSLASLLYTPGRFTSWDERVGIALNIAKGILYLHEECETQIIHCDIKPQNILMDENWCAKIADFGLAKLLKPYQTGTFTKIRGTRGYVAPEWHKNLPITVKVDVYSFGVVLLEIICRRRSVDMKVPEEEAVLVDWVYECFEARELGKLGGDDEDVDKGRLESMVRVALWCLQEDPTMRPSMKKVVLMLEETLDIPIPPTITSSFSEN